MSTSGSIRSAHHGASGSSSQRVYTPEEGQSRRHHTDAREIRVAKPDLYQGDRNKLDDWFYQFDVYFKFNPTDADKKTLLASTYLRGPAQHWLKPYLRKYLGEDSDDEGYFGNWVKFKKGMKAIFGTSNEQQTAIRVVQHLTQKTSASAYAAKFQEFAQLTEWDDEALATMFRRGLKDAVKDELMRYGGTTNGLENLITASIELDDKLYERSMEKRHWNGKNGFVGDRGPGYAKKGQQGNNYYGPMPMELDATERKPHGKHHGKKTIKCYACGKIGHMARNCRGKKMPPQQINATQPRSRIKEFCMTLRREDAFLEELEQLGLEEEVEEDNSENDEADDEAEEAVRIQEEVSIPTEAYPIIRSLQNFVSRMFVQGARRTQRVLVVSELENFFSEIRRTFWNHPRLYEEERPEEWLQERPPMGARFESATGGYTSPEGFTIPGETRQLVHRLKQLFAMEVASQYEDDEGPARPQLITMPTRERNTAFLRRCVTDMRQGEDNHWRPQLARNLGNENVIPTQEEENGRLRPRRAAPRAPYNLAATTGSSHNTVLKTPIVVSGHKIDALIDSGASANFASTKFVQNYGIATCNKGRGGYQVIAVDGSPLPSVSEETTPLKMAIQRHHEMISFDIVDMTSHQIVLGLPWLRKHNPSINWHTGDVRFSSCDFAKIAHAGQLQSEALHEGQNPNRIRAQPLLPNPASL